MQINAKNDQEDITHWPPPRVQSITAPGKKRKIP